MQQRLPKRKRKKAQKQGREFLFSERLNRFSSDVYDVTGGFNSDHQTKRSRRSFSIYHDHIDGGVGIMGTQTRRLSTRCASGVLVVSAITILPP